MKVENNTHVSGDNCRECAAHAALDDKLNALNLSNIEQHNNTHASMNVVINNIEWMNKIGKWILATLISYFIAIGYMAIYNPDIKEVKEQLKENRTLYKRNVNKLYRMSTKINKMFKEKK